MTDSSVLWTTVASEQAAASMAGCSYCHERALWARRRTPLDLRTIRQILRVETMVRWRSSCASPDALPGWCTPASCWECRNSQSGAAGSTCRQKRGHIKRRAHINLCHCLGPEHLIHTVRMRADGTARSTPVMHLCITVIQDCTAVTVSQSEGVFCPAARADILVSPKQVK